MNTPEHVKFSLNPFIKCTYETAELREKKISGGELDFKLGPCVMCVELAGMLPGDLLELLMYFDVFFDVFVKYLLSIC